MPRPSPPQSPVRAAHRHWAAFLAPAYLIFLVFLRDRFASGPVFLYAAAAGGLTFLIVLAWNLFGRRSGGRLPDSEAILIWGGAVGLVAHVLFPVVAWSRAVPGALFFALGMRLPSHLSVPISILLISWFAAMTRVPGLVTLEALSTAAMAAVAGAAGAFVRRRLRRSESEEEAAREGVARSRSMVLPWEEPHPADRKPAEAASEETVLLRREIELRDGVRRALESVLPLTGASHAAFLAASHAPGNPRHDGILVSLGERRLREFTVPETYVPVREATVFHRPFVEEGPDAARYSPWEKAGNSPPTGIAAVPVMREGTVEGVILVVREEEGPWTEPVVPLLELVAYFTGREIDRTRAQHQGERHLLREDWYHRMVRKMAQIRRAEDAEGADDILKRRERVYAEAVTEVRRQAGASRVLLVGSADGGQKGWIAWEETAEGARSAEHPEPLEDSYVAWVIRKGTQRIFSEAQGPPHGQEVLPPCWQVAGERSFLVLPVAGSGVFRGALVCAHPEERRFHRQHADLARDVAEVMQLGLSHVEHLEALTRRAATDGLTGLSNRKAFLARIEEDLGRLDGRHPCAVVMLDIDHFKRINDTYGHPFGDEVLRRVSGILGKAVRKGDAAGRYGGEEFVLYLHMAGPAMAQEVAERFRRMIRQARIPREGKEITITASFGVACAPAHGKEAGILLKRADEALYLSKQRGRDRVTVYPG